MHLIQTLCLNLCAWFLQAALKTSSNASVEVLRQQSANLTEVIDTLYEEIERSKDRHVRAAKAEETRLGHALPMLQKVLGYAVRNYIYTLYIN